MKFLVIQQKMIGDVLTSSILCDNLKKEFPDAEVHYMAHKHTTAVVAHHPSIDRLIAFDPALRKNKARFYRFIKDLDKEQYDVLIDPYTKIETALIAILGTIPKRMGYYKWYSAFAYTHPVKRWRESKFGLGLTIENRLQLLLPLLKNKDLSALVHKPKIHLLENEKATALNLLEKHGIREDEKPLMIAILGSGLNKSYPAPYMAALLDMLASETNSWLLFNYIPKQYEEVRKIYDLCQPETQARIKLDLFADSLRGFIALLSHCGALIGNEGGAVNMAKALDVPTFSIFSPWIPKGEWALFEDSANRSTHLNDHKPELYRNKDKKQLKKEAMSLYREFTPDLVSPALKTFIQENNL